MDYGHTNPEAVETRSNTGDSSWEFATPGEHNTRAIGNRAIFSSESSELSATQDELGVIRSTEPLVPTVEQPLSSINESLIAPRGDHISNATADAIDNLITEFKDPSRPLSDTYSKLQQMREVYQSKIQKGNR